MRYFLELSYNGKNYHGWQVQPNVISVQEKINEGLSKLLRVPINIMGAGRTDAGVHALQMYAHFDVDNDIDTNLILDRLNSFLLEDIVIYNIFKVDGKSHTRFHAISRSYEYRIYLGRNPFLLDTTWQLYRNKLDVDKMNEAAKLLLNHDDFKCFSKSTDVNTYICDVTFAEWKRTDNLLTFHISANRFLRNMIRAIVGTLIDVGMSKVSIEDFKKIMDSRSRSEAGFSVPARGLFLTHIEYPESILKNE
ncbi:MAG: tRNA pseudouridine(38-40) synthase TruA [Flavobacteriaceae bacterium]|nr:tRNA pseudouridine(38-40) synthase TruA [Flavobacteriaceae bacterium]